VFSSLIDKVGFRVVIGFISIDQEKNRIEAMLKSYLGAGGEAKGVDELVNEFLTGYVVTPIILKELKDYTTRLSKLL
jgi:hypothetical protein